ncbi:MAG TPA: SpoIIE family protein phosphatase [Candidatus Dormibacteraeota bacterium]|nr:SpoIIE family protein phosphatase [Candidatus Dormibacteraeota bacterium]
MAGFWPQGWIARGACYSLGLAAGLFVLQMVLNLFAPAWAGSIGGWVKFLVFDAALLFSIVTFRWLRWKLLWRLRNRLIVTYVFIGVIPAILLVLIGLITIYLFAGQFSGFVVTSEINSQLRSMQAVNAAVGNELAARIEKSEAPNAESLAGLRKRDRAWSRRRVCAWHGAKILLLSGGAATKAVSFPDFFHKDDNPYAKAIRDGQPFKEIVRDHGELELRVASVLTVGPDTLTVITSEPLDKDLMADIAANLGEITLLANGIRNEPTFTVGRLPAPSSIMDREIGFGTPLRVVNWSTGENEALDPDTSPAVRIRTMPSVLYGHLFASLEKWAKGIESILLAILVFFAIIELISLLIGTRMTRTVTGAVAQLYDATRSVDRGDFSHRIPVKSTDQLAQLSLSFNSMTESIEKLIQEQKEKQRLEGELAIAQEVQAQLFPRQATELESLEVHGFCRPARTVSGDYYDFLTASSHKLILAVGDISGKGISAALLMATIHSAVRAYSVESLPQMREPVGVGALAGAARVMAAWPEGIEISPGALLGLLNHQLYESTPPEKYATLFLAVYDGRLHRLTYSNGGHLPPLLIAQDGGVRRLEAGGTVVGLFDNMTYDEDSVDMHPGEIFLAYSDGVSEPENEFGEFGEERLIDLVRENRRLPLVQISQTVTQAVDDWIGDQEQPDDITLVLARAR